MNALLTQQVVAPQPQLKRVSLLNVTAHIDASYGGICAVVPSLCSALAEESGASVSLAAFCSPREIAPTFAGFTLARYSLGAGSWLTDSAMRRRLAAEIRSADAVHVHGLWREHSTLTAWLARYWKKPYVISAHGMLQGWALADKRLKKAAFSWLVERRNLAHAACLHALTSAEVADYRSYGLKVPVAIVPNGVNLPTRSSPDLFLDAYPHLRGRRLVLFLGRIHYKKGVDLLCRAWASVQRRFPDAHLVIAGPDFANTQAGIETLVRELGAERTVTFTGMLHADMKWSALDAADLFILPSHSEGLSVSVLEAMGRGLPVIVTKQCNIPEVRDEHCGLVVQPVTGELAEALTHLLRMDTAELNKFGSKGRQLIRRRYSWETVARQMGEVYQWMLSGQLPSNVEVSLTR